MAELIFFDFDTKIIQVKEVLDLIKWLSIPEYSKMTGLSRVNINKLIHEGEIVATETDGGGQVRIKYEENSEFLELKDKLNNLESIITKLSEHFGVKL